MAEVDEAAGGDVGDERPRMPVTPTEIPGRSALVAFGSETGNAQDAAEEFGRVLERLHFSTRVLSLDHVDFKNLTRYGLVILVISTTGQGDFPANARQFWRIICNRRIRPNVFSDVKFTSFGLGDSSYPRFNWAHRKLHKRVQQLGAQLILERGEADEQDPSGIEQIVIDWSAKLYQMCLEKYPLPQGVDALGTETFISPKWRLDLERSAFATTNGFEEGNETTTSGLHWPGSGDLSFEVLQNSRITPLDHEQDVRHFVYQSQQPVKYEPGDVMTVWPQNDPDDVAQFIEMMGWTSIANMLARIRSTNNTITSDTLDPDPCPISSATLTIRELLLYHLDFMSVPRRSFFNAIVHFTNDQTQRERLIEFAEFSEDPEGFYDYTTRTRRSILEVLQEFHTVRIPYAWILYVFPTIKPRQFSIASGGQLKFDGKQLSTRVELLVAIVEYRTILRRVRRGLCTRYLATMPVGTKFNAFIQRGGLDITSADICKPIVMVGPGTGVAPMRSLIHERLLWASEHAEEAQDSTNLLFFGCRSEKKDFFFADEWSNLESKQQLSLVTAFSRDQRQKIYVQDRMADALYAQQIYRILVEQQGLFYVSGSSGNMPKAVRRAIASGLQTHGEMSEEEAELYLTRMEKEGRYKQETW